MRHRSARAWALTCLLASMTWMVEADAASFRTRNFIVTARSGDVARQVAEYAEYYRQTKAIEWLGQEMADWRRPCQVVVKVIRGEAGGATSFGFHDGQVLTQDMTLEGPLDRILDSVLPHEVTHTVFAAKFGRPLPRWADEGGAVLSEDHQELARHDLLVREIINTGRMIPLSRLFVLTEYPDDVMALYAQGFSVANYLVSLRGKSHYLDFVWDGQVAGWDAALNSYYGIPSTHDLERRWIDWLRVGRGTGSDRPLLASAPPLARRALTPASSAATVDPFARPIAVSRPIENAGAHEPEAGEFPPAVGDAAPPRVSGSAYESPGPRHTWLRLPTGNQRDDSFGQTTINGIQSTESAGNVTTARPRIQPLTVGRTRRGSP